MNPNPEKKPEAQAEAAIADSVQRVVSRPHPWKSAFSQQQKLKAARREYNRRKSKQRRDDGIEYFRLTEKAWHKAHPNGANTGNPKFRERAIKANAAKSANDQAQRLPTGDGRGAQPKDSNGQ